MERDEESGRNTTVFLISTHTLTWSVTYLAIKLLEYVANFNSHAHVERDFFRNCYQNSLIYFNSHAHVERDVPLGTAMFIPRYFNSHAHVERDT